MVPAFWLAAFACASFCAGREATKAEMFAANNNKTFSWHDPILQQRLWTGVTLPSVQESGLQEHVIDKRALRVFGPAWKILSCLGCAQQAQDQNALALLQSLTTEYLITQMKLKPPALQSRCIFYTSRPDQFKVAKPGQIQYSGLSYFATLYACMFGMVTIWSLWNNGADAAADSSGYTRDYYAMFTEGSWLFPISKLGTTVGPAGSAPGFIVYFQNMSRAMAEQCNGDIYVMSDLPEDLGSFASIWGDVEYPAIYANYLAQEVTSLKAIDAATFAFQDINIATLKPLRRRSMEEEDSGSSSNTTSSSEEPTSKKGERPMWPATEEEMFERMELLARKMGLKQIKSRDSCQYPISDEPSGMDFFG